MKIGGVFLFACLWIGSVFAQTDMEKMFQKDNPNLVFQNEARTLQDTPLVYLEGISNIPQPKTWKDRLKIKLFGSMEIPKTSSGPELDTTPTLSVDNINQTTLEFKPAFGPKKQIAFFPYTPDWHFVITQTDNNVFNIHEELSFIQKNAQESIVRDWPIKTSNFHLLKAQLDRQILPNQTQNEKGMLSFILPKTEQGVHKIQLDYLITTSKDKDNIQIPLIGSQWPFMADTFSGVIFSNNNKLELPEFLIGTNKQTFPENFTVSQDEKGNIFFKMKKILPAKTQIYIKTKSNLPLSESILEKSFAPLFFFIVFVVLFIYLLGSALEIKYLPLEKKLKKFHVCSQNKLISFIVRNKEILIGSLILDLIAFIFHILYNIQTPFYPWILLILYNLFLILMMDYFFIYREQKEIFKIHDSQQKETL